MVVFVVIKEYTPGGLFGGETDTTVAEVFSNYYDALDYCTNNASARTQYFIEEMLVR